MARESYPADLRWNDKRRKVNPHVRVHHSITNHPKTTVVFQNNDLLAAWLRVMILASEKGAAHTNDTVTVSTADLSWISGRSKRGPAADLVRSLCGTMGWPMVEPSRTSGGSIQIRNFTKKQGLTPHILRASGVADYAGLRPSPLPSPHTPLHMAEVRSEEPLKKQLQEAPKGKLTREEARDIWNEVVEETEGGASERRWTRGLSKISGRDGARFDEVLREYGPEDFRRAAKNLLVDPYWRSRQIGMLTLGGSGNMERMLSKAPPPPLVVRPYRAFQVAE
jgi:hypothetical protein